MFIVTCQNEPCSMIGLGEREILIQCRDGDSVAVFEAENIAQRAIDRTLEILDPILHLWPHDREHFSIDGLAKPHKTLKP